MSPSSPCPSVLPLLSVFLFPVTSCVHILICIYNLKTDTQSYFTHSSVPCLIHITRCLGYYSIAVFDIPF